MNTGLATHANFPPWQGLFLAKGLVESKTDLLCGLSRGGKALLYPASLFERI